jgi:hypothetical protein
MKYNKKKVEQWKAVAEMIQDQAALDQIEYIQELESRLTWRPIAELEHERFVLLLNNETGRQIVGKYDHSYNDGTKVFEVFQSQSSIHYISSPTHFMELPDERPEK